jgi:uncharacterized protein (DUF433 family)
VPITFSLKEVAALVDVPERTVRRAVEQKVVRARAIKVGHVLRYRIEARDLVFVKLLTAFPFPIDRNDKEAWQQIIGKRRPAAGRWRLHEGALISDSDDVEVRIELKNVRRALANRLRTFRRGRRRIVTDPEVVGGEPIFEGTRIPLSHITGLIAKGVPKAEIAEDYPALGSLDLEYAALATRMRPSPGRPRRPLTLLRDGQPVQTRDVHVSIRAPSA